MLHYIYTRSLGTIAFSMMALLTLWGYLRTKLSATVWRRSNLMLTAVSVMLILYTTIFSRTAGDHTFVLAPFAALKAAQRQPELYREMLMNVFLFFPLGMTLCAALPRSWRWWGKIAVTVLTGCLISVLIEFAQYRFGLGTAETDDVICNTFGALVGTCWTPISYSIQKHKKRS